MRSRPVTNRPPSQRSFSRWPPAPESRRDRGCRTRSSIVFLVGPVGLKEQLVDLLGPEVVIDLASKVAMPSPVDVHFILRLPPHER